MLENSVIFRTGQRWKFVLALCLLLGGSFLPLVETLGMSWTTGTVVAVVGYAYGCLMIRCPGCGSRWFWRAALDASLYKPLLTQAGCPACGANDQSVG